MTWQVRIKGPRHLAASGLGRSDGTVDPGPLRDAIHPPVDGDRQEVLKVGEVRDGEESYLDGEELGELYLLLLLDDAGPSPVDVDRQEVLEDGEVYDQDESYQGDEDLDSFAPPSSSSMVPVPEVSASWGSSFRAFSTSSSYHPLPPSLSRAMKWSHEAAPAFAPPGQEPFAFRSFTTPRRRQSGQRLRTAPHFLFRRHGPRHRCPAGRPRSAIVPPDASPEEREEAVSWGCCCSDISSALQVASRLLTASCAHGRG